MTSRSTTVLDRILAQTREEVDRRKRAVPLEATPVAAGADGNRSGRLHAALSGEGVGVIAEFKRRSPSAGALHERPDLAEIVGAYERGGAVALSILTEGPNFGGALEDLRAAGAACGLALLRKDFVLDPYQLIESVQAGADGVLLIVAALTPTELAALYEYARTLGLDVLVEVHDRRELEQALEVGAEIVGINNRDLRDFSVDLRRTEMLMDDVPDGVLVVSESGIAAPEQMRRLRERGVAGALVGESLMRAEDPEAALLALLSEA